MTLHVWDLVLILFIFGVFFLGACIAAITLAKENHRGGDVVHQRVKRRSKRR